MAEKIETLPAKYILLEDTKRIFDGNKRSDLIPGDLLIALPEADQPEDREKIALTGRNHEDLRVECPTSEVAKLTDSEADLLMAVTSAEERFCIYQKHLADVKSLSVGSDILVNLPKDFRGVIKYKGTLSSTDGTMFGVELCKEASGQGTTDGTFRNERYFTCSQDSGVFVAMDKIRPDMELSKSHRIKQEQCFRRSLRKVKSKIQRKKTLNIDKLKIEQSVVVFVDDKPVRGRVKWMSQIREAGGHLMVGIELKERMGKGKGDYKDTPRFRCKKGFALFAPASTVIPEEKYNSGIVSAGEMDESSGARPKRNSTFYTELPAQENIVQGPSDKPSATQPQVQGDDQGPLERSSAAEPKVQESPLGRSSTTQLAAEQKVRFVAEQLIHKGTKDKLAALRQAYEDIRSQLAAEQQAHGQTQSQLAAVKEAREDTQSQLAAGQQEHGQTQSQLAAEQQALRDTRKTLREVRLKLSAEKNTHEQTKMEARSNLNEAESTNLSLRQALEEFRNAREECDWMIDRNDIEMSGKEIGRGAWGIVVEGRYRETLVAIKKIHELILSPHNRQRFEREMCIASRCRHPCLLQFIGATNDDGSPLFVTELLDTSLRAVLDERRRLERAEITTIALDVARALNYLHLNRPDPIIHRDISSSNVLLWKHGERWRAKVSDYGSANFIHFAKTVNPGAPIYSAPEAQTPRQSIKVMKSILPLFIISLWQTFLLHHHHQAVDVYSFGVLLCEMDIQELPDPSRRDEQVAMVTSRFLRDLIRRCLDEDPENRPSMKDIIHLLEGSLSEDQESLSEYTTSNQNSS